MGSTLHRIFPFVCPALFNLLLKTLQKENPLLYLGAILNFCCMQVAIQPGNNDSYMNARTWYSETYGNR